MLTLFTFGDSILDCGRYNEFGVDPGRLLLRNDDRLFPDFCGRDLTTALGAVRLEHRARDGATVDDLRAQMAGVTVPGPALALLTIGGNDLLRGLAGDRGRGIDAFAATLEDFRIGSRSGPCLSATCTALHSGTIGATFSR